MAPAMPAGTPHPAEPLATGPFPESASATLQGPSRSPGHTEATLVSVQGTPDPVPHSGGGDGPTQQSRGCVRSRKTRVETWPPASDGNCLQPRRPPARRPAATECGGSGDPETGARRSLPAGLREGCHSGSAPGPTHRAAGLPRPRPPQTTGVRTGAHGRPTPLSWAEVRPTVCRLIPDPDVTGRRDGALRGEGGSARPRGGGLIREAGSPCRGRETPGRLTTAPRAPGRGHVRTQQARRRVLTRNQATDTWSWGLQPAAP